MRGKREKDGEIEEREKAQKLAEAGIAGNVREDGYVGGGRGGAGGQASRRKWAASSGGVGLM